jgi:hypothetical protein
MSLHMFVKAVTYKTPMDLLGKSIAVYTKKAAKGFDFKVTGCGEDFISGFDSEGMNLKIDLIDIDCIVLGG